ncbi:MAG: hypothetical protein ACLSHX_17875 [Suilimivivens sp.]
MAREESRQLDRELPLSLKGKNKCLLGISGVVSAMPCREKGKTTRRNRMCILLRYAVSAAMIDKNY